MQSTITHGRRKGEFKSNRPFEIAVSPSKDATMLGTNIDDVAVLSREDWDRIQRQLHRKKIEQKQIEKMRLEKEQMIEKSRNLVQHWHNTISGQRQLKLHARKLREQKDEEDRKAVDIEEAKYQAEKRKDIIDKAKTQMYYQTDRLKNFHTALRLTETVKEREQQIELKNLRAQTLAEEDKKWHVIEKEGYENWSQSEHKKIAAQREKNIKHADFVDKQRKHMEMLRKEEKENELKEGDELRRLADEYKREQIELDSMRREEQKQLKDANCQQLADKSTLERLKQKQIDEEEEECRIFAAAKRKMIRLRHQKEQEIYETKTKQRDNISRKLLSQVQAIVDDEEERTKKAIQERDELQRIDDELRKEHLKRTIKSIDDHRKHQLAELEEAQRKLKQDQLDERKKNEELDDIFKKNEAIRQAKLLDFNKDVAKFHLQQHEERKKRETGEKDFDIALCAKNDEWSDEEEKQFQEYAKQVIDYCKEKGRNVYPLVQAAKAGVGGGHGPILTNKAGMRPSYIVCDESLAQLPNYQTTETDDTKQVVHGQAKSKNKMGFIW